MGQKADIFEMDTGAYKLALNTVIRALVEHASGADPELRGRITSAMETYIANLAPQSEREEDFAERARGHVASLVRPPS
ncbi:hypothetical protein MK632_16190 [Rhizobium changzhiense]|uniref:Uncharacterized protein n=1 Tax=Rhizobium changzhiense TaxID=2692317 RepID=A0A7Z0UHJ1_9HYPH|nr:hypothetical protein [Rhizobium changzhiense]MCH4547308.1 hypothetical protein [Rhizobium changzhiense]NZD65953.1 hypothetical protein [Rhizobium changzhiense]